MTRYLAALGHRRIAFIAGHEKHKAVANRLKGYKDGLKQAGLPFTEALVAAGDNSIGSGEAAAAKLLLNREQRTDRRYFAANDDMAAGVIRVAHRMGIDVPSQLSVAGFDDSSLAQQIFPALTTVRQPLVSAMAAIAAQALIDNRGNGGPSPGSMRSFRRRSRFVSPRGRAPPRKLADRGLR